MDPNYSRDRLQNRRFEVLDSCLDPSARGVDPDFGSPNNLIRPLWDIAGYDTSRPCSLEDPSSCERLFGTSHSILRTLVFLPALARAQNYDRARWPKSRRSDQKHQTITRTVWKSLCFWSGSEDPSGPNILRISPGPGCLFDVFG